MMIKAAKIDMLKAVVAHIDLIKNLPSNVKLDSLSKNFEFICVISLFGLSKVSLGLSQRLIDFVI